MDNPEVIVQCSNGFTLYVEKSNLTIVAKRTEETIPISKIQSFSLKMPGAIKPGMIVFRTAQAASSGLNLGFGVGVALGAEKSFFFSSSEAENAVLLRDHIINFDNRKEQELDGKVVSIVDEIRGLKELLDEGILTQDQFEAKKKQLLGI